MQFKLKTRPQDFIVEELASLPLSPGGAFSVYLLKKSGRNTDELIRAIARSLRVAPPDISYGARKDRHGLTSQYITIRHRQKLKIEERDYTLSHIGFMERPMGVDLVQGNRFAITVRRLSAEALRQAEKAVGEVLRHGYPNYFDDQRFGPFDSRQGFLADKALRQEFNGALKVYLTGVYPKEKGQGRRRKEFFFAHWKEWQLCLKQAKTRTEKEAFGYLCVNPSGFLRLLQRIPGEELSFLFTSYQSYLWNEMLRRLILSSCPGPFSFVKGRAGDYVFYAHPREDTQDYLAHLSIPTPGRRPEFADERVRRLYAGVLEENRIRQGMFNKLKLRQAYFKSFARPALVVPQGLNFDTGTDELYGSSSKMCLRFVLGRGSFATMCIKRLFCEADIR